MLGAWTLLLVWGLLPFSQGIVENVLSVAQLDKSVLESVASDTLGKGDLLQGVLGGGLGGLLGGGGGLVGGVLGGQGGPLDGVLGGQGGGLVGGVLGGQGGPLDGVLGGQGGGLVGGVLGGQGGLLDGVLGGQGGGLVGGLLGGQGGPLDGVLGGQGGGLVGGVLGGQGGPLDGVLGGQGGGLVGGVLGGQGGPLDGVLGGQGGGLIGGVLGGQGGPLDGVLGGQGGGLVGGVLGGQGGPLDGVLGGEGGGLVGGLLGGQGGLLDGVLGGQGGGLVGGLLGGQGGLLNGVLGGQNGGLVGGLLGGNGLLGGVTGGLTGGLLGGDLLGLKILDIVLPKISLKLRKNVGIDLNVYTKVKVNLPLLPLLNLHVEVNITAQTRLVKDASGAPKLVVQNCKTLMGGIKIMSGLPLKLDWVGNLLNNLLPGVLCPVIELVVNVLNTLLGTISSICPFGLLGQLHYTLAGLPLFQDQHILLNLNLMITDPEGKTINLPPVQLPVLPEPAAGDHVSQLVLPGELISTLIGSLGSKGLLNADITQQTLRGNVPMTTTALQSLIPAISLLGAPSLPLVVRIRLNELPHVSLQNGEVFVSLAASIEVLAHTRFGPKPLFELAATVGLSGKITPGLAKLSISLALKSLNLRVASSVIGSINVGVLEGWIQNLLVSEYLPILNGALEIGIPLPKLFNLNFDDATVSVVKNALVVGTAPKLL